MKPTKLNGRPSGAPAMAQSNGDSLLPFLEVSDMPCRPFIGAWPFSSKCESVCCQNPRWWKRTNTCESRRLGLPWSCHRPSSVPNRIRTRGTGTTLLTLSLGICKCRVWYLEECSRQMEQSANMRRGWGCRSDSPRTEPCGRPLKRSLKRRAVRRLRRGRSISEKATKSERQQNTTHQRLYPWIQIHLYREMSSTSTRTRASRHVQHF